MNSQIDKDKYKDCYSVDEKVKKRLIETKTVGYNDKNIKIRVKMPQN